MFNSDPCSITSYIFTCIVLHFSKVPILLVIHFFSPFFLGKVFECPIVVYKVLLDFWPMLVNLFCNAFLTKFFILFNYRVDVTIFGCYCIFSSFFGSDSCSLFYGSKPCFFFGSDSCSLFYGSKPCFFFGSDFCSLFLSSKPCFFFGSDSFSLNFSSNPCFFFGSDSFSLNFSLHFLFGQKLLLNP